MRENLKCWVLSVERIKILMILNCQREIKTFKKINMGNNFLYEN